jgi:pimeloyl-ACP methyl ester carboxylesterase
MGKGPRLLLVHGSVLNGEATWNAQRPLAERLELVVPNRRGFPPGPCVEALKLGRVSAAAEAVWLEQFLVPGTHLVGQSYGGVIALLAAARRPELLASLTVIEPPAFDIARGHPAVDAFVAAGEAISGDPESYLRDFLDLVGAPQPGYPLSPALLQGARMLMVERPPWEAEIPLEELAAAPFPMLAVSGAHSAAFDAVCDVLEQRIGAERAVLPGAGHSPQRLGKPFNELLASFIK